MMIQKNILNIDVSDLRKGYIPAFLQLDLPTIWDEKKIIQALDDVRLDGTSTGNIKIKVFSTADLNIFAEIADSVLDNIYQLPSEINTVLSSILSAAKIITSTPAKVGVNLTIPDIKGNPCKCISIACFYYSNSITTK